MNPLLLNYIIIIQMENYKETLNDLEHHVFDTEAEFNDNQKENLA